MCSQSLIIDSSLCLTPCEGINVDITKHDVDTVDENIGKKLMKSVFESYKTYKNNFQPEVPFNPVISGMNMMFDNNIPF